MNVSHIPLSGSLSAGTDSLSAWLLPEDGGATLGLFPGDGSTEPKKGSAFGMVYSLGQCGMWKEPV